MKFPVTFFSLADKWSPGPKYPQTAEGPVVLKTEADTQTNPCIIILRILKSQVCGKTTLKSSC